MMGHFVRGLRCRIILRPHCEISTWTATNVVISGYGANNVLPARLGEVVRAYMLSRTAGVPVSLSLAITFVERFLDGLVITGILLVAGYFVRLPGWGRHLLWLAGAVFLGALVAVVLVMLAKPFVLSLLETVTGRLPRPLAKAVVAVAERAIGATDCLRKGSLAGQVVALSIAVWLVEGTMFLVILPAFGLAVSPLSAALAMAVTNLGILIPSSPGYIGPFHYFCMQALRIVGVARQTALGYAIMAHLLYFTPVTVWGLLALAVYGVSPTSAATAAADPAALATRTLTE